MGEKKKDKQNGALDWEGPRQCGKQEELHIRGKTGRLIESRCHTKTVRKTNKMRK